ncbi:MAG: hypothetical protein IJM23_10210 [Lachnospiraceae bacterium]|nr:hypothetical protein [Lachnospiraceae bacterium]
MDLLKFVNSNDIREHLNSIDYKINAKEAVWLVYQSWYTTLREQIDACRYIEENLPDVDLGDVYDGFIGTISFAKDLPDWMDDEPEDESVADEDLFEEVDLENVEKISDEGQSVNDVKVDDGSGSVMDEISEDDSDHGSENRIKAEAIGGIDKLVMVNTKDDQDEDESEITDRMDLVSDGDSEKSENLDLKSGDMAAEESDEGSRDKADQNLDDILDDEADEYLDDAEEEYLTAHQLASAYGDLLEESLSYFYEEDKDAVYSYEYYMKNDSGWSEEYEHIFSSLKRCLDALKKDLDGDKPVRYVIRKSFLDSSDEAISLIFNGNDEPIGVDYPWNDMVKGIVNTFEGLGCSFPTPFKKGDILLIKSNYLPAKKEDRLIVMEGYADGKDDGDENPSMIVWGCLQEDDGTIVQDHTTSSYMNCERYTQKPEGKIRIMKLLSDYIKGEAGLEELLCFYRKYLLEELANDMNASYFERD